MQRETCARISKRRVGAGFTLLEILIVLAVISLLAAILLPVLSRVRENARRTSCQSNLKQLSLAYMQYTQDNDERLPNVRDDWYDAGQPGGWMFYSDFGSGLSAAFEVARGSLYPYVKSTQLYMCSSDTKGLLSGNSYAVNSCLIGTTEFDGLKTGRSLSSFHQSSLWMLLGEEANINDVEDSTTDDGFLLINMNKFSARHFNGSNIAFLDGHVKWYQSQTVEYHRLQAGGGSECPADS